jgi:hypothetical protein
VAMRIAAGMLWIEINHSVGKGAGAPRAYKSSSGNDENGLSFRSPRRGAVPSGAQCP